MKSTGSYSHVFRLSVANFYFGGKGMKRKISGFLLAVLMISGVVLAGVADSTTIVKTPMVATVMGDDSGSIVLELVCMRYGIECVNVLDMTAETLGERLEQSNGPKTLVIATGAMTEGDLCTVCGAIEIDIERELERIEKLIEKARASGLSIVGLHIEGGIDIAERNFNRSIDAIMPYVDLVLLVTPDEVSSYFKKLSEEKGTPMIKVDEALKIGDVLKELL